MPEAPASMTAQTRPAPESELMTGQPMPGVPSERMISAPSAWAALAASCLRSRMRRPEFGPGRQFGVDHRAEARAAAVVLAAVSGHEVEGQLGAELHADGAAFAELLDDRVFARSRLLDRVEPAEGKALGAVDAVVGVEDGEMPAHEVGAHLGLGLEKNVKVGGVDVIVADDDLLAGAHGARKRCGDAGLACAALAAQYDDLMHDGLPRKGC